MSPPDAVPLRFGEDSSIPHLDAARARGIEPLVVRHPGIGMDIDNPVDLVAFLKMSPPAPTRTLAFLEQSASPAACWGRAKTNDVRSTRRGIAGRWRKTPVFRTGYGGAIQEWPGVRRCQVRYERYFYSNTLFVSAAFGGTNPNAPPRPIFEDGTKPGPNRLKSLGRAGKNAARLVLSCFRRLFRRNQLARRRQDHRSQIARRSATPSAVPPGGAVEGGRCSGMRPSERIRSSMASGGSSCPCSVPAARECSRSSGPPRSLVPALRHAAAPRPS